MDGWVGFLQCFDHWYTHYLLYFCSGLRIEIQYSLLTFGIRCGKVFNGGQHDAGKRELFQQYHARRVELEKKELLLEEEVALRTGIIPYPKPDDVLIGRGSPYHGFAGNIRLSRLIDSQLARYRECGVDNFRKTCISMDVVKSVEEYGGRFIQKNKKGWLLADYTIARQKAANAFRAKMAKFVSASSNSSDVMDVLTPPWKMSVPAPDQRRAKRGRYDETVPEVVQISREVA
jgi:hypothetical protein